MEFQEDDLVLGVVEKIEHMNVFVKLEDGKIGTIVHSEIAPGRIKNLREYVSPNKIIVCKILRSSENHLDLSLRRVTARERKEVLTKHQQEKDIETRIKAIAKEDYEEIINKIKSKFTNFTEFIEKLQQNAGILDLYFPEKYKEQAKRLAEKKIKEIEIKKIVKLKCFDSEGVYKIKQIFKVDNEKTKITYISAGNYLVSIKSEDYKKANKSMQDLIDKIEAESKKVSCELSIEDKK